VSAEQFADAAIRESWLREKGLTVFGLWSDRFPGLEVDLFVAEPFDFDAAYSRSVTVTLDTTTATVVALSDLIALKKAAGRPVDLADIEALCTAWPRGRLDGLGRIGIHARLRRASPRAGHHGPAVHSGGEAALAGGDDGGIAPVARPGPAYVAARRHGG
jgi:hypothetical protein